MYPSNINGGGNTTPISFGLDQTIPSTSTFIQDDPSSSFFYFPTPSLPYEDDIYLRHQLHELFLQQPPFTEAATTAPQASSNAAGHCNEQCHGSTPDQIPRKRSSKKDRHSKIDTAHGPRDRRMRLSLDVAPQFFGLQDLLGFDKASKTVGWLLNKSKSAIKELNRGLRVPRMSNSSFSGSEDEAMSGIDEPAGDGTQSARTDKGKPRPSSSSSSVVKEKKIRAPRKPAFNPAVAKESREKARARARERTQRTREKKRLSEPNQKLAFEATNHEMNLFECWSSYENGEESSTQNLNTNPSLDMIAEVEDLSSSIIFSSYYDRQISQGVRSK
ncbi:transcription factor [Sarracenia purpurea var. burkii]